MGCKPGKELKQKVDALEAENRELKQAEKRQEQEVVKVKAEKR